MNLTFFVRIHCAIASIAVFFWALMLATVSYAGNKDITGHYEAPPIAVCSAELLESENVGNAYRHHCFTGSAYGYSTVMAIIQNGNKVCGRLSECGGIDCNKVYDGELVGHIRGNILTVYFANGHRLDTAAEKREFRILKNGLTEQTRGSHVPSLVTRSVHMKYPEVKAACNPQIPEKVMISSNFELIVPGRLDEEKTTFINLKTKTFAKPLKPRSISLIGKPGEFEWEDKRLGSNTVISQLILNNNTKHAWEFSVEHPDSCREFLGSYYHETFQKIGSQTKELKTDSITIAPKQSMRLDSCLGSKWFFKSKQNDKNACPPYQCLEGCKC